MKCSKVTNKNTTTTAAHRDTASLNFKLNQCTRVRTSKSTRAFNWARTGSSFGKAVHYLRNENINYTLNIN